MALVTWSVYGMRMVDNDKLIIITLLTFSCAVKLYAVLLFVYWFIYHIIVSAMFTFQTHTERKTGGEKQRQTNGVDLWRRFLERVSWT